MAATTNTYVILLRAIGPVTHKLMSMAAWRNAAKGAGFGRPEAILSTGNMVAEFSGSLSQATSSMSAVLRGFGLKENIVPVLRRPSVLQRLTGQEIFADADQRSRQMTLFFFVEEHPDFSWVGRYEGPEKLRIVEDHLLIDFGSEANQSGTLLRRIDKFCGTSTARSLNTVQGLIRLCANRGKTA